MQKQSTDRAIALALFSGGLDSILACRIIAEQGIEVQAIKFVTPFFDHDLLAHEHEYQQDIRDKYGIEVELIDLSDGYIDLLRNPAHGFGKNFNPCIDCKILMLNRARELMAERGASFLITGEVLGQRPMSQRRDTLNIIERDSQSRDFLLRPLSAQLMNPTLAEQQGLVDRDRLYGFAGRGRKPQVKLAKALGIKDFPMPGGGCVLTDPNLASRIERFYEGLFAFGQDEFLVNDFHLLLLGRHFRLPGGHWLILGRNEQENEAMLQYQEADDWRLHMPVRPGPMALLRRAAKMVTGREEENETVQRAAGLVVRYGKKTNGKVVAGEVLLEQEGEEKLLKAAPLPDAAFKEWIV